jgi:hypothetical protein
MNLNHFLEECAYFTLHGMFTTKSLNPQGPFSPLKLSSMETYCEVDTAFPTQLGGYLNPFQDSGTCETIVGFPTNYPAMRCLLLRIYPTKHHVRDFLVVLHLGQFLINRSLSFSSVLTSPVHISFIANESSTRWYAMEYNFFFR